jgi:hypothetical protein
MDENEMMIDESQIVMIQNAQSNVISFAGPNTEEAKARFLSLPATIDCDKLLQHIQGAFSFYDLETGDLPQTVFKFRNTIAHRGYLQMSDESSFLASFGALHRLISDLPKLVKNTVYNRFPADIKTAVLHHYNQLASMEKLITQLERVAKFTSDGDMADQAALQQSLEQQLQGPRWKECAAVLLSRFGVGEEFPSFSCPEVDPTIPGAQISALVQVKRYCNRIGDQFQTDSFLVTDTLCVTNLDMFNRALDAFSILLNSLLCKRLFKTDPGRVKALLISQSVFKLIPTSTYGGFPLHAKVDTDPNAWSPENLFDPYYLLTRLAKSKPAFCGLEPRIIRKIRNIRNLTAHQGHLLEPTAVNHQRMLQAIRNMVIVVTALEKEILRSEREAAVVHQDNDLSNSMPFRILQLIEHSMLTDPTTGKRSNFQLCRNLQWLVGNNIETLREIAYQVCNALKQETDDAILAVARCTLAQFHGN